MKAILARAANYNIGRLADVARIEPVVVEKYSRPFVVVISVEEYERLSGGNAQEFDQGTNFSVQHVIGKKN